MLVILMKTEQNKPQVHANKEREHDEIIPIRWMSKYCVTLNVIG